MSSLEAALGRRIKDLAEDVGRLRRGMEPGSSAAHVVDRIAGHVATLHLIVTPSAAELAAGTFPGDSEAVAAAVEIVDSEWHALMRRLGQEAA